MKKKIVVAILSLCVAAGLTACQKTTEETVSQSTEQEAKGEELTESETGKRCISSMEKKNTSYMGGNHILC